MEGCIQELLLLLGVDCSEMNKRQSLYSISYRVELSRAENSRVRMAGVASHKLGSSWVGGIFWEDEGLVGFPVHGLVAFSFHPFS